MKDENKTKEQLIEELLELRRRNTELEESEARCKQATAALYQSKERHRILLEQLAESVVLVDGETLKIVDFNAQAHENLGFTREEFEQLIVPDLEVLESSDDRKKHAAKVKLQGEDVFETQHRAKNGEIRDVLAKAKPISFHGKDYILAVWSDITERKRMEEELRESEEKYRVLVENANEGIAVAQDGMFKFTNPKMEEITGYSQAELSTKSFVDFIHPDDRELVMGRYQKRLKGEELPTIYPFRFVDKGGNSKWTQINAVLIDWEGKPATLAFLNDITERKRMEEELLRVEKLESIGVLAGGIAHDLNNLLTGVMGNISLARLYEDPAEKDKRLVEAEKASMQIKNLTQQLLTFSRGGAPILQTADIGELMKSSAGFSLSGSNVRCDLSIPDDLWPVEIDEGQINQVINNLIINAKQAMPNGGVISMRAENVNINAESGLPLKDGAYIKVSVQDKGMGIPAEHIPRIFDPFFSTKQEGSGLGLATAYSIIEKHNGHIIVESQMGVGTTFYIYLPASPEGVLLAERAEEEKPVAGVGRILVMDDEEIIRELANDMLISTGYTVTTATDGAETIELYKKSIKSGNPFDAVVIDLTVPGGMGGRETIQRLIEINPEVKAIVSSGYSNDPIMADFAKHGFMGVVAKPYKTKELSEIVHRVITG